MTEINATILIPDISGFTEFMTSTELSHGSRAVNILIDAIIRAVGDTYEVSEIEGDAVLLIKKGPAPSKNEILGTCLKIFNTFHFQRKWMQQHMVCPCKACKGITNLTLKFVAHHGALAEIRVGRFVKHSGPEMIIAHRLLKNSIGNNEYLLLTDQLLGEASDASESDDLAWKEAADEYASLGQVRYRFALLGNVRQNVPDPPPLENSYISDSTPYATSMIAAPHLDVYMTLMNIPCRHEWIPGLRKVEQDMPDVFIGSNHCCTFEEYEAIVSPLKVHMTDDEILFAETCRITEIGVQIIHEFRFLRHDEGHCMFSARFLNIGDRDIPVEIREKLSARFAEMAGGLKAYCESRVSA